MRAHRGCSGDGINRHNPEEMAAVAEILVAKEPFSFTGKDGIPRVISAGQEVSSDDPDVKGREHLFEPAGAKLGLASRATETATAGPGERRTRSSRHTTSAKESGDDE